MKILVYGLPKSGTTVLAHRILQSLPPPKRLIIEPGARRRDLEDRHGIVTKELWGDAPAPAGPLGWWRAGRRRVQTDPRKIHADYADYEKKIWIARDPRDALVSQFFYQWFKDDRPSKAKFREALKMVAQKEENPGTIPFRELTSRFDERGEMARRDSPEYLSRVCDFVGALDDSWLIVKYENMVDRNLAELSDYLGHAVRHDVEVPGSLSRVARSRGSGSWRDWFTEDDVSYWKPKYEAYMRLMAYDPEDWRLNHPRRIPPDHGSVYMERLFHGEF